MVLIENLSTHSLTIFILSLFWTLQFIPNHQQLVPPPSSSSCPLSYSVTPPCSHFSKPSVVLFPISSPNFLWYHLSDTIPHPHPPRPWAHYLTVSFLVPPPPPPFLISFSFKMNQHDFQIFFFCCKTNDAKA